MAKSHPVVSLDEVLAAVVGTVSINGVAYDVLGLNAEEYEVVKAVDAGELPNADPIWACIRRIVPSMPEEVFKTITMPACGTILGVAVGMIARVDAALPNSSGPTTTIESPASPESPSEARGG